MTFDNRPVVDGVVTFEPSSGGKGRGSLIKRGRFTIEELAAGSYRAHVAGLVLPANSQVAIDLTSPAELRRRGVAIPAAALGNDVLIEVQEPVQKVRLQLTSP